MDASQLSKIKMLNTEYLLYHIPARIDKRGKVN